ncbi:glutamine--tRNA ligase/YqeY domain fusion protein [Moraxellaceae bacterium AER2_44_116]|nr:glutamine--tRNA ligase/YqeY domain fusion protein [Moraxellaceae bacterium]TQC96830.1 glutamine--tRNA ligase/YqeY domain fusion protein [Moraxellaceae bacterium AER2_44_116]
MEAKDFIRAHIVSDLDSGKHSKVITRFPPEPNGYLHIGHAKSICLNFGVAAEAQGECNLRFDDTNPEKESQEYIDAIQSDVTWLGFQWAGKVRYASDYFDALYQYAIQLIKMGKAYVDSQTPEEISKGRSTLIGDGLNSPYRERTIDENLALFEKMRAGEFNEGDCVLRAKIDMASGNINLRDPVLYRIKKIAHHQTGNKWLIYPMYDYTHPISDAIENITHSLCTLEFEDHRPFYDWLLDTLATPAHPQQIEFSRLNLNYTVTSKRKLKTLVDDGTVTGWDDPRMPTIAGLRRRGYTPESLRDFCERIGVSKNDGVVDFGLLEFCVRNHLENTAPRAMAVLNPLKVVITNMDDELLTLTSARHPNLPELGSREIPFTRDIIIDAADFSEDPPKGFKRLVLGGEVRLRHSYVIRCDEVVKNATGEIVELRCSADLNTLGKNPEGRKVKGVIQWVSASKGVAAEVRLYDRLFTLPNPESSDNLLDSLNPDAFKIVQAWVEPSLADVQPEDRFQFEREGYFVADLKDCVAGKLVFNKTVSLRDSWGVKAGE